MSAARRKKHRRVARGRPSQQAGLTSGDRVCVKRGVKDPDFPDMSLGGWVGTVREIDASEGEPLCLVEWSKATLGLIHPVFKSRCERDGFQYGEMWIGENDLEPDAGLATPIDEAHPVSRPFSEEDQDDRVRVALGLTSDDPLPNVDEQTLRRYGRHLSKKLSFPFEATVPWDTDMQQTGEYRVKVVRLLNPNDDCFDAFDELICEVLDGHNRGQLGLGEFEVAGGGNNAQLVKDYAYWFWNHR